MGVGGGGVNPPYIPVKNMLDVSLATADDDEGIDVSLTVRNVGDEPVTLRFRTGQRADFAAYAVDSEGGGDDDSTGPDDDSTDPDGDPVWRYGEGRLFTQALGTETLGPGESTTYGGTWSDPPSGTYRLVGEVTAEASDETATAVVEVD